MAVSTLIATPGSSAANAYVTLAVANQYHEDRPPADEAWVNASDDEKTAAILWATKLMDSLFIWQGWPKDTVQALLWPRTSLMRKSGWEYLDDSTIPIEIQWATAEFARQLLVSDRLADDDIETKGLSSLSVPGVSMTFSGSGTAKQVPDAVRLLVPDEWGAVRSRVKSVIKLQR